MATFEQMAKEATLHYIKSSEVNPDEFMKLVREWYALPWGVAKAKIKTHMEEEGGFSKLDFDLLMFSESVEDALGDIWGI